MDAPLVGPTDAPNTTACRRSISVLVFITYLLLWSIANWPALRQAWWYSDDFIISEQLSSSAAPVLLKHVLANGRPGQGVWYLTFLLDGSSDREIQNRLLRFMQGGLHALAGVLAADLLWRQTRRWTAFLSVLPFILWPFNGEATLWRTAGQYPLAALLGLLGVQAIRRNSEQPNLQYIIGPSLIVLGMLTNQSAAFAGAVVWVFVVGLIVLDDAQICMKRVRREAIILVTGYCIGGVASFLIARLVGSGHPQLASNILGKLVYLLHLNRLFITWPEFYPPWLSAAHILLLSMLSLVLVRAFREKTWTIQQALLAITFVMTGLATPYAAILLVARTWPAWRVMYLAPFLITGAATILAQALATWKVGRTVSLALVSLILAGYVKMAWINSSEYVKVFEADLHLLQQLENYAAREHIQDGAIYVTTFPEVQIRDWNPYGLEYVHGDSKLPAFFRSWSAHPFVRRFSWLRPTQDTAIRAQCLDRCRLTMDKTGFRFYKLDAASAICVCPP